LALEKGGTSITQRRAGYARKLHNYKRWRRVVDIFGVYFPVELSLVKSTGVDDGPRPQSNRFCGTLSIEQAKAFLAKLNEAASKGEGALRALIFE